MIYVYKHSRCIANYPGYMSCKSGIVSIYSYKVMVNYTDIPDSGALPHPWGIACSVYHKYADDTQLYVTIQTQRTR